jgi:hypothetical protein
MSNTAVAIAKALTPSLPSGMSIDVTPGSEYAALGAAALKVIDAIIEINNTPAAMALRQDARIQALLNKQDADLEQAQATGDITNIDKDASG